MRIPKHLSPSSIQVWLNDRSEFYLKYLADNSPPRFPQTQPMSVGSAFDAYVKCYLSEKLGIEFPIFEDIFEKQVEEQNRDFALEAGKVCFDQYKESGALSDLMLELEKAQVDPRFEFRVEGKVKHESCIEGIPVVGYPDIYFFLPCGTHCIYDWKVNGFCASTPVSPKPGYLNIRDGWKQPTAPPSRGGGGMHKNCIIKEYSGLKTNAAMYFEDVESDWATQCLIYSWLLGASIGSEVVIGIDQLCCKPFKPNPLIRVASHRGRVSQAFQMRVFKLMFDIWTTINSVQREGEIVTSYPHIFDGMTKADNDARCEQLDNLHKAYGGNDPNDKWFQATTRSY